MELLWSNCAARPVITLHESRVPGTLCNATSAKSLEILLTLTQQAEPIGASSMEAGVHNASSFYSQTFCRENVPQPIFWAYPPSFQSTLIPVIFFLFFLTLSLTTPGPLLFQSEALILPGNMLGSVHSPTTRKKLDSRFPYILRHHVTRSRKQSKFLLFLAKRLSGSDEKIMKHQELSRKKLIIFWMSLLLANTSFFQETVQERRKNTKILFQITRALQQKRKERLLSVVGNRYCTRRVWYHPESP